MSRQDSVYDAVVMELRYVSSCELILYHDHFAANYHLREDSARVYARELFTSDKARPGDDRKKDGVPC